MIILFLFLIEILQNNIRIILVDWVGFEPTASPMPRECASTALPAPKFYFIIQFIKLMETNNFDNIAKKEEPNS